jgi:hypothetical protein
MNISITPTQDNTRIAQVDIRIDVITFRALQKTLAANFNYTAIEAQAMHDFTSMIEHFKVSHLFVT